MCGCATGFSNGDRAEARFQIEKQIYAYTYALDGGDLDALGELFEHATMRVEGTDAAYEGAEAVRQTNIDFNLFYDNEGNAGLYRPDTTPRTRHVTTNVIIDVAEDGSSATARSSVVVFQFAPSAPLRPILAAGYRDRFEPIEGRWRFVERIHLLTHIEDVRLHLRQPPPGQ
ncbi:MAG: hypothetical protein CL933_00800 [Deltaproteobacteria bacterium]|nr:hypothetical protein [Deltaproteobacteria bacterium]